MGVKAGNTGGKTEIYVLSSNPEQQVVPCFSVRRHGDYRYKVVGAIEKAQGKKGSIMAAHNFIEMNEHGVPTSWKTLLSRGVIIRQL